MRGVFYQPLEGIFLKFFDLGLWTIGERGGLQLTAYSYPLTAYRLPASGFAAKVAAHKLGKRRIMKTDSGFAAKPDSFHQLTSVAYGATSFPRKEAIE